MMGLRFVPPSGGRWLLAAAGLLISAAIARGIMTVDSPTTAPSTTSTAAGVSSSLLPATPIPKASTTVPAVTCARDVELRVSPICAVAVHAAFASILPSPTAVSSVSARLQACPGPPGCTGSHEAVWSVAFMLPDGSTVTKDFSASPGASGDTTGVGSIPSYNSPDLSWPYSHDLPCVDQSPSGDCAAFATPQPTPDPDERAQARPLTIDRVLLPLSARGHVEVPLGVAGLPRGYHTRTSFELSNAADGTYLLTGIRVDLRPVDPDAPPFGGGLRRLVPGVEDVTAVLVMDVESFLPGAVVEIVGLVVE